MEASASACQLKVVSLAVLKSHAAQELSEFSAALQFGKHQTMGTIYSFMATLNM